MTEAELVEFAGLMNQPPFRGRQLYRWLYAEREAEFEQMTDLPLAIRNILPKMASADPMKIVRQLDGSDGSLKLLLEAEDGLRVESVLIPEGERLTACLSSQVGCAVGCSFCATGLMGFKRNLTAGEIIGQLFAVERTYGRRMTNVVMMGMGEPFLNRPALFKALPILADPDGVGLSRRHITISTAGWLPGIRALIEAARTGAYRDKSIEDIREGKAHEAVGKSRERNRFPRVKLALSLNAVTDEERLRLMPLAGRYPLKALIAACGAYAEISGERTSINYLLLAGENDSSAHAQRLAALAQGGFFKIGLMEYNEVGESFRRAARAKVDEFVKILTEAGVSVTVRTSRGRDIAAACGQLAGEAV